MKKIMFFVLIFLLVGFLKAEIKTIFGEYSYTHSDDESKVKAMAKCLDFAKRDAVEKFATYISSVSIVEDYEMKKDRVVVQSCGLLRNIKFIEETYDRASAKAFYKISAEIDEEEVMKLLKEKQDITDFSEKILDHVESGMKAEKRLKIGDALKNYYWAYLLQKYDFQTKDMKYDKFDKRLLSIALPERINSIFNELKITIREIRENNNSKSIVIGTKYKNKAVDNLDVTYYTGDSWSSYIKIRNGLGLLDLYGSAENMSRITIKVEYKYDNLIKFDDDMNKALEKNSHLPFSDATFRIPLIVQEPEKEIVEESIAEIKEEPKKEIKIEVVKNPYIESIDLVLEVVKSKKYHEVKHLFTDSGYEIFNDLIFYGNAELVLDKAELKTYKLNDQVIVRSVPMSFSFPRNDTKFVENVIFTFDKDKKIDVLTFGLSDIAVSDIIDKPEKFGSEEEKMQLIHFMELYKTSYCLQQINYIESIFADNALIIVGKMLQPGEDIGEMYNSLSGNVKYEKMGKQEYIKRLRKVFNSNEFVNIYFEDNVVAKKNKKKIYSIEIKQYYHSTNYSDEGYLFLLMDLNDIKKPQIYVRAWQPDSLKEEDRLKLADFKL